MADGPDIPPPLPLWKRLTAPGATLAPFGYAAFTMVWLANMAAQFGSQFQSVGAAWLMTELTTSHALVAAVQAAMMLPILLIGVPAGAIADNFDRRLVMLWCQVGALVVATVLAVLAWADRLDPWSLLAFTVGVGLFTAASAPAWQAAVRMQVPARELPSAISLNTVGFNIARSLGPALGGILITVAPIPLAFTLNALSFLAMIVVMARWRPDVTPTVRQAMLPSILGGIRFCAKSDPLRRVLLRGLCGGIGLSAFQSLLPAIVRTNMDGTKTEFGLVLGGVGAGSIVAALAVTKVRRRLGSEVTSTVAMLATALGTLILGMTSTLWAMMATTFLLGASWVTLTTTLNVAMQLRSPDEYLGRCLSLYQSITYGAMALGAWTWGTISDAASLGVAMEVAAGFSVVAVILLRLFAPMPAPHEGRVQL